METIPISEIIDNLETPPFELNDKDKLYIFGRNPELSLAETISCYNSLDINKKLINLSRNGVIIHNEQNKHISIQNTGSVLKKAIPVLFFKDPNDLEKIKKELTRYLDDNVFMEEKSYWGLSLYNQEFCSNANQYYESFQSLVKKSLKSIGIKRAFFRKPTEGHHLEPKHINHKDILRMGFELILWFTKEGLSIAFTEEVLDVEQFERRDINRRHRRPLLQIGLALARTMINLVSVEENRHNLPIYDPFCGIATIPQEGYLLNFKTIGSDIDSQCVKQSKQNIGQFLYNLPLEEKKGKIEPDIFQMDICRPDMVKFKDFEGSIVSEPDLLQPLMKYPSRREADPIQKKYILNYHDYLDGLEKILKKNQVAVLVFPQIHLKGNRRLPLPVDLLLQEHRFELCYYTINNISVPSIFVHNWKEPIIERQIIVFKKK